MVEIKPEFKNEFVKIGVDYESFNRQEKQLLIDAYLKNLQIKYLTNPKLGYGRMLFIKKQMEQGLDVDLFAKECYDLSQMMVIARAIRENYSQLEIRQICDPGLTDEDMLKIFSDIKYNRTQHLGMIGKLKHKLAAIKETIIKDETVDEDNIPNQVKGVDKYEITFESEPVLEEKIEEPVLEEKIEEPVLEENHLAIELENEPVSENINTIDLSLFDDKQKEEINKGLEANINVSIYAKKEFFNTQMRQLRLGLEHNINVDVYANPEFPKSKMKKIRIGIEEGLKAYKEDLMNRIKEAYKNNPDRDIKELALEIQKEKYTEFKNNKVN